MKYTPCEKDKDHPCKKVAKFVGPPGGPYEMIQHGCNDGHDFGELIIRAGRNQRVEYISPEEWEREFA